MQLHGTASSHLYFGCCYRRVNLRAGHGLTQRGGLAQYRIANLVLKCCVVIRSRLVRCLARLRRKLVAYKSSDSGAHTGTDERGK